MSNSIHPEKVLAVVPPKVFLENVKKLSANPGEHRE